MLSLLLSGRFDAWAFVSAIIIAAFVLCLPLFKYSPALENVPPKIIAGAPVKKTAKKSKKKKVK